MAIMHSLIYGGVDSAAYDIYITGTGVYNAPERAVELVQVPGRNGAVAIDQGHWENIEVKYTCGCFGDDQSAFAAKIADFRSAVTSLFGYQRLTDTYNPGEYREAMYISGLEVAPVQYSRAGEFELTFNCKPQRFLTSGETAVSITSGDALVNPTSFESRPLLTVKGAGSIEFNGYEINVTDGVVGKLVLAENTTPQASYDLSGAPMYIGDELSYKGVRLIYILSNKAAVSPFTGIYNVSSNAANIDVTTDGTIISVIADYPDIDTTFKASGTLQSIDFEFDAAAMVSGTEGRMHVHVTTTLQGLSSGGIRVGSASTYTTQVTGYTGYTFDPVSKKFVQFAQIVGFSTIPYSVQERYIDCEIGEAYMTAQGFVIPLNNYVDLGSRLPKLAPGSNIVTYSGSFTSVKITPRWYTI